MLAPLLPDTDFSAADAFFNSPSVRAALGVTKPEPWSMCNFTVLGDFNGDQLRRFDKLLPDLLSDGIRVLIYAGPLSSPAMRSCT